MGVAVLRQTRILSQGWMWLVIRLVALLYANCCYGLIDLIQRGSRNKLSCHILENPNRMAATGKQSTDGLESH